MTNIEIILLLLTAIVLSITIWLIRVIILKQRLELESDKIQSDLRSNIYMLKEKLDLSLQNSAEDKRFLDHYRESYEEMREKYIKSDQINAIYKERIETLQREIKTLQYTEQNHISKIDQLQREVSTRDSRIKELETQLTNEKNINKEKIELLEENKHQMMIEFKELADKILKSNSQEFSQQSSKDLESMIAPIKEQFGEFKKQINDIYIKETQERSMLQAEIKNIKEINLQMTKEANNLTNALKGESKTQGIWGEMILERVLENSGLVEGESYKREVTLQHERDNNIYRPDVIVYLPDSREVIIDAKTSLVAYEQYISTHNQEYKKKFANQHIASIKRHIKELSEKDYTRLKGVNTLDFIFMFIPVESAVLMAMEHDSTLFDHAFKRNIILVGPTTLMVALRAVENSWKYEYQRKNATEIAKRAGLLFDKFVGYIESMERLGRQIQTVQKSYDDAYNKLHTGSGSITSQFQKLEKLGAASSKRLPKSIKTS
jgi:DNA recombination protein RmuC